MKSLCFALGLKNHHYLEGNQKEKSNSYIPILSFSPQTYSIMSKEGLLGKI